MNAKIARNPWEERILRCLKDPDLSERLRYRPVALPDLQAMPADTATGLVRERLEQIYVPSPSRTAIARRMLGVSHAQCLTHYANVDRYEHHVRNGPLTLTLVKNPITWMLTSEAGLSKSQTIDALMRALGDPDEFKVGDLPRQRTYTVILLRIKGSATREGLLNALARAIGYPADYCSGGAKEILSMQRQLYQAGVMLIIIDELQLLTRSSAAHAQLAGTLHYLRQFGIPILFVGNFSLGHRLKKRPQEDRQRFLLRPEILLPDAEDDTSYVEVLEEFVRVMSGVLAILPKRDAPMFHWYTGGNLRMSEMLVEVSYGTMRASGGDMSKITMSEIAAAYDHRDFRAMRADVEICRRQLTTGEMEREDLWCPFELDAKQLAHRVDLARNAREAHLRNAALVASMTPEEKDGLAIAEQTMAPLAPGLELPKPRQSRTKSTVSLEGMMASKPDFSQRKRPG